MVARRRRNIGQLGDISTLASPEDDATPRKPCISCATAIEQALLDAESFEITIGATRWTDVHRA